MREKIIIIQRKAGYVFFFFLNFWETLSFCDCSFLCLFREFSGNTCYFPEFNQMERRCQEKKTAVDIHFQIERLIYYIYIYKKAIAQPSLGVEIRLKIQCDMSNKMSNVSLQTCICTRSQHPHFIQFLLWQWHGLHLVLRCEWQRGRRAQK